MQGGKVEATSARHAAWEASSSFVCPRGPRRRGTRSHKPAGDVQAPPKRITPTSLRVVNRRRDVAATAKSMSTILGLWQHETKTCSDGSRPWKSIRTFRPDVVLADLALPQMSGYQLAEEIPNFRAARHGAESPSAAMGKPADKNVRKPPASRGTCETDRHSAELEQILDDLRPAYRRRGPRCLAEYKMKLLFGCGFSSLASPRYGKPP